MVRDAQVGSHTSASVVARGGQRVAVARRESAKAIARREDVTAILR